MRRWPDTLPTPSEPGFGLAPVDQVIRTDMEVGARRVRRVTFARLDHVDVQWTFNDAEMAAFRAWWGDEAWSLAGDSDDLTGWAVSGTTINANVVVGPDNALADRIVEDGGTSQHHAQISLGVGALASNTVLCRATIKAAGRGYARLGMVNRAGVLVWTNVDLAAGSLGTSSGLISATLEDRGSGWWRVTITADSGVGGADPILRIAALSDASTVTYAGSAAAALSVCEVNARLVTGYDLFVRTDAAGGALGASGGSAWVEMPLAVGGGYAWREARFTGPFKAQAGAGLNWDVSAALEVRNA